jgi:hypothetical protein
VRYLPTYADIAWYHDKLVAKPGTYTLKSDPTRFYKADGAANP